MPNRILKESICTSTSIANLTPEEEVFFYRLIVNCDDYGCLDALPTILRAKCFPLRIDGVTDDNIRQWIIALIAAELVQLYQHEGKAFIHIKTWANHQQIRAKKRKYPEPPPNGHITDKQEVEKLLQSFAISCNHLKSDAIGNHLIADESKCPRNPIQSNPIQSESNPISLTGVKSDDSTQNENLSKLNKQLKKYPHKDMG